VLEVISHFGGILVSLRRVFLEELKDNAVKFLGISGRSVDGAGGSAFTIE